MVFRMPLPLYRAGLGWILGTTFVAFTHLGRRTGVPHTTAAMVLRHDRATGEVVVCSVWGPTTDWVRNLRAAPATRVQLGRTSWTPLHRFLDQDEAYEVALAFRERHPWRLRLMARVLDLGDLSSDAAVRELVEDRPFVAFRRDSR